MCRDDTKLSHLASTDLFHPLTGTRHVTFFAVVLLFVFCVGCFCFALVCLLVSFRLLSVLWVVVSSLTVTRDLDYVSVLYQLLLRPIQLRPLRELIN